MGRRGTCVTGFFALCYALWLSALIFYCLRYSEVTHDTTSLLYLHIIHTQGAMGDIEALIKSPTELSKYKV